MLPSRRRAASAWSRMRLVRWLTTNATVNMTANVTICRKSETAKLKSGGMKKNSNETTLSTAASSDGP